MEANDRKATCIENEISDGKREFIDKKGYSNIGIILAYQ